jgi:hypothetical protein
MATSEYRDPPRHDPEPSGWAVGGLIFAATILTLVGTFQAIIGLAAIIEDQFFVVGREYAFEVDTTAYGWIHLFIGIIVAGAGFALFAGRTSAVVFAIFIAGLSAVANFFSIPYYPFWAILVIALNVWVIWSLTRPGVTARE